MTRTFAFAGAPLLVAALGVGDTTYKVLSSKESKFQEELDRSSADGYRLVTGDAGVQVVVLERTPGDTRRSYLFAADVDAFLKEKKLQPGYRLVTSTFGGGEFTFGAIFEKVPGDEQLRDYRFVKPGSEDSLRKRLQDEGSAGSVVAIATGPRGIAAISEHGAPSRNFTLIATGNTGTLSSELAAAADKGQCIVDSEGFNGPVFLLKDCPAGTPPRGYQVIATTKAGTFEKELNAAAAKGMRLVPESLVGVEKKAMFRAYNNEIVGVVENAAGAGPVTYRALAAIRLGTLTKEMQEAADEGFTLVAFAIGPKESLAVLEKK